MNLICAGRIKIFKFGTSQKYKPLMWIKKLPKSLFSTQAAPPDAIHKSQAASLSDLLIKVSKTDKYLGSITKKEAHLTTNQDTHRAFSLFVFDDKYRLLLQQRSPSKITFPKYWTNTCCSHPVHINAQKRVFASLGVRVAAMKRVKFEMGIRIDNPFDIYPVQKVFYQAKYNETWGENEVDYVLFAKLPLVYQNKPHVRFNKDEVMATYWADRTNISSFLKEKEEKGQPTTPWMKKILDYKLLEWWELFEAGKLKKNMKDTVDLMAL